jgi:hypothetical protein
MIMRRTAIILLLLAAALAGRPLSHHPVALAQTPDQQPADQPPLSLTVGQAHIMPTIGLTQQRAAAGIGLGNPIGQLVYRGGSVQHRSTTHIIMWQPSGTHFEPSGTNSQTDDQNDLAYENKIVSYFQHVGGSALYNILTQYPDTTNGAPANDSTLGDVLSGAQAGQHVYLYTDSLPNGETGTLSSPVLDDDIQNAIEAVKPLAGWSGSATDIFFVFTPYNVNSCFDAGHTFCSGVRYCAYHGYYSSPGTSSSGRTYYASGFDAWGADGCDYGHNQLGAGWASTDPGLDNTINTTSHEHFETVTDPDSPTGWTDSALNGAGEIGDKCYHGFGPQNPTDGSTVTLNGANFFVQQEWNNAAFNGTSDSGCSNGLTSILSPTASVHLSHTGSFRQGDAGDTYTLVAGVAQGSAPTKGTITITELPPAGLTITSMSGSAWTCATLPVCTYNANFITSPLTNFPPLTVVAAVAATAPASLTNQARVAGLGDVNTHTAFDATTIVPLPALSITKSHSGSFAQGANGVHYTLTVSNGAGAGPSFGQLTVTDVAPPGLTVTGMAGTGWTCSTSSCSRSDALSPTNSYPVITVTANVSPTAPSTLVNHASVTGGGDPSGPHTAADPTAISGNASPPTPASLSINGTTAGFFVRDSSLGFYFLTVSNATGAGATSGTVTVRENPPPGLTVTSMTGAGANGWACTTTAPWSCTRSDALLPGDSYPAIKVGLSVAANAAAGSNIVSDNASVIGGGDPTGPHTTSIPTTILP